jgi:glycosyltransferase involved in cell wall biosynthesis
MRILQVNKFFYVKGGSERYFFDLCGLLGRKGHEVFHFSMRHDRNEPSGQSKYFVSGVDLNADMGPGEKAAAVLRVLYSSEAKARISRLLDDLKPDIIHFHNITRQLSPSIVDAAAARSIPMVQTLHDLSLVCPAHSFYVNGAACEECAGGAYWHVVPKKCIDGLLTSSLLGAAEAYLHSALGLYKRIDRFIAPSMFLKGKVSTLKWIRNRISHLPYFIPPGPDHADINEGYALFAGRISREKGVGTLLDSAALIKDIRFVVAGEGPLLDEFRKEAGERGLANIEFVGYATGERLEGLLKGAGCVVVPSISYENLPLSILEAFSRGKPVVASDAGGSPELVENGTTGYVFRRGDPDSLSEALQKTMSDEGHRAEMGSRARALVVGRYSPDHHYRRLMDIYEDLR